MEFFLDCLKESLRFKRTFVIAFIMVLWAGGVIVMQLTAKPEPEANEIPRIQNQKDDQEAFLQCLKDADAGSKEAQYELSIMYAFGSGIGSDKAKSTAWCQKAAVAGHPDAQIDLGYKYYSGGNWVTTPDYAKALEWYKKAADAGHPDANYRIGSMYFHGEGVNKDNAKAFEYFKLAAENGHRLAKYRIAWMYENGRGVEKNESQAAFWYNNLRRQTGYSR